MFRSNPAVEARKALEADWAADDISVEEYTREEARIDAGSAKSEYLRAARGRVARRRIIRWAVVGVIAVVLAFSAFAASLAGQNGQSVETPSNPSVAPAPTAAPAQPAQPQVQPQQQFDDDDFEEDDD